MVNGVPCEFMIRSPWVVKVILSRKGNERVLIEIAKGENANINNTAYIIRIGLSAGFGLEAIVALTCMTVIVPRIT